MNPVDVVVRGLKFRVRGIEDAAQVSMDRSTETVDSQPWPRGQQCDREEWQ